VDRPSGSPLAVLFRLLVTAGVVLAVSLAAGGRGDQVIRHEFEGPVYRQGVAVEFDRFLAKRQPEVVLLGNSLLLRGVDRDAFVERTGLSTERVFHGGAASALYYVMMKNVITRLEKPPRIVGILFRHVFLTEPTYRTHGGYRRNIDYYVQGEDPELDRLAFLPGMDRLEHFLTRNWALYARRAELREAVEAPFELDLVARLAGISTDEVRNRVESTFQDEVVEDDATDSGRRDAVPLSEETLDFDARVGASFLPHLIELADQAGIRLVLIRLRTRDDADPYRENPLAESMRGYDAALDAYAAERGVPVLDFVDEPRIRLEHFKNDDHLNEAGKVVFTELLAERFRSLLESE